MINEPQRWLDRLVSACFSVLLGALALYGSVWLLCQIWIVLVAIAVVGGVVVTAVFVIARMRRGPW